MNRKHQSCLSGNGCKQKEVIEGCLLGDGYISIPPSNSNAVFGYSTVQKKHLNFIEKLLKERNIKFNTSKSTGYRTYYNLKTVTYPELTKMRKEWYVEKEGGKGRKRMIPENFRLTPLKALLWYIGDGSWNKEENVCVIAVSEFKDSHLKRVNEKFEKVLGSKLRYSYHKNNIVQLRTSNATTKKFLNFIETRYGHPGCYDYKFPSKSFYKNRHKVYKGDKVESIRFRCSKELFEFVKKIVNESDMDKSEVIRGMVNQIKGKKFINKETYFLHMPRKKEKSIRFRCSKEMYDFLDKLRGDPPVQKEMSEVIRNIINVFRVAWLMGDLDLPEMTKKLKEKMGTDTNSLPYKKELASS